MPGFLLGGQAVKHHLGTLWVPIRCKDSWVPGCQGSCCSLIWCQGFSQVPIGHTLDPTLLVGCSSGATVLTGHPLGTTLPVRYPSGSRVPFGCPLGVRVPNRCPLDAHQVPGFLLGCSSGPSSPFGSNEYWVPGCALVPITVGCLLGVYRVPG